MHADSGVALGLLKVDGGERRTIDYRPCQRQPRAGVAAAGGDRPPPPRIGRARHTGWAHGIRSAPMEAAVHAVQFD
eukprot:COSAG01_NODE_9251_length_2504_cov_2.227027_2_plen_76_part_00